MEAVLTILILTVIRLVIPFSLLIVVGSLVQRRIANPRA